MVVVVTVVIRLRKKKFVRECDTQKRVSTTTVNNFTNWVYIIKLYNLYRRRNELYLLRLLFALTQKVYSMLQMSRITWITFVFPQEIYTIFKQFRFFFHVYQSENASCSYGIKNLICFIRLISLNSNFSFLKRF